VQGDAAALRQRELDALDPANRALLMRIFALEDETAAAEAATAAAKAIADERYGLEARLLQVQGDAAALRQREIDALDPSNRALLMRIFALEDETAAAEAAAAAAKAIADERFGLETRLLQLQGNTAALRQRELDALDPSNRALLMRIFAIEDATAAAETQTASLRSLAGEHQRTVDIFGRLALDLRAYREKLLAGDGGTPEGYAAARDRFGSVAALARAGDAAALGELRSVGDAFLAASMANSRSAIDYQRDLAGVIGAVDEAAFAAEAVADYAEVQRQAAERQIGLLERIAANTAHMAGPGSGPGTGAAPVPGVPAVPASAPLPAEAPAELLAELRALRQESRSHSVRANELLAKLEVYHKRWDGGDHMKTSGFDPDTPAYVEVLP
jgi:hypothetical protein